MGVGVSVGVGVGVRVVVEVGVFVGSAVNVSATAVLTSGASSLIEAALALVPQEVRIRTPVESTGKRNLAGLCFIGLTFFQRSMKDQLRVIFHEFGFMQVVGISRKKGACRARPLILGLFPVN